MARTLLLVQRPSQWPREIQTPREQLLSHDSLTGRAAQGKARHLVLTA